MQAASSLKLSPWLSVLIVGQMAFVTAVSCSAGLLCRSFQHIAAIRPAMDLDRPLLLIEGGAQQPETLASELAGLPGVLRVAYARRAPLAGIGGGMQVSFEVSGRAKTNFHYVQVSPTYFATTGARILAGRVFGISDSAHAAPVVMVSQSFVRLFMAGRDPIGAWFRIADRNRQVVGIVWSAARMQADSLKLEEAVCANVSGLFVKHKLLATKKSAHSCPKKWVELEHPHSHTGFSDAGWDR